MKATAALPADNEEAERRWKSTSGLKNQDTRELARALEDELIAGSGQHQFVCADDALRGLGVVFHPGLGSVGRYIERDL